MTNPEELLLCAGLHVVLLPEMAFSGYTFRDRAAIRPCLEDAADGPTAKWCQLHACRLRCSVVCGFPRRVMDVRAYLAHEPSRSRVASYVVTFRFEKLFIVVREHAVPSGASSRTMQELALCVAAVGLVEAVAFPELDCREDVAGPGGEGGGGRREATSAATTR
jgi:hypothetical protein